MDTIKYWGRGIVLAMAILLISTVSMAHFSTSAAQSDGLAPGGGEDEITYYDVTQEFIAPDSAEDLARPQPELSSAEAEALQLALLQLREETAAAANIDTSAEAEALGQTDSSYPESTVGSFSNRVPDAPGDLLIPSNILNTQADNAGNSTLAEPAAANEGPNVFYAGNFRHNEFSTNGGGIWNNVVVPGGPSDAPTLCCDWDVVYDQGRGVTFISGLYLNAAGTNGVVRIFVRRDIAAANNCSYTIDPAGASNNTVPDYPHINISNDYLYLTTNNTGGAAGGRAQVRRFNMDQMYSCVTAGTSTYSYVWPGGGAGQRVFVPVEGARETMYWGMHVDLDTMRIFSWPETAAGPSSVNRNVNASSFGVNEDCTGGTGGNDWWDSLAASIIGFNERGAVGHGRINFYWPVASDAAHTQGHIHGAIFQENSSGTGHVVGNLLAQPVIFNNSYCFGLPHVSANERGDIGMVLAYGGNLGAGGAAARPAVGIDDDFTTALGTFSAIGGNNFTSIAAGTHNRSDSRYGDYFTIHPHEPCDLFFNATGYALNGGTSVANVNARYVEFGRTRDNVCYTRWDDEDPTP